MAGVRRFDKLSDQTLVSKLKKNRNVKITKKRPFHRPQPRR